MTDRNAFVSRRGILRGAMAAGAALPVVGFAPRVIASMRPLSDGLAAIAGAPICRADALAPVVLPQKRALKFTWNATAICTVGIPVAMAKGYFTQHNLDVELVNFGGSTDELLEAMATGKADAGVGMALRWLKPLENGFDVKIAAGIHGGCMRLFAKRDAGIATIADLRGKAVGVTDLAAPDKNFFSIMLKRAGVDPGSEIDWRAYPGDLLPVALQKGEIQAFCLGDPLGWVVRDRDNLLEVANNLTGDYGHRTCCVLGISGPLVRDEKPVAIALVQALLDAQTFVHSQPDAAAAIFAPYSKVDAGKLADMLRSHTHGHNPLGSELRDNIAAYAEELKLISVLKPSTDPARYAEKVTADLLS